MHKAFSSNFDIVIEEKVINVNFEGKHELMKCAIFLNDVTVLLWVQLGQIIFFFW